MDFYTVSGNTQEMGNIYPVTDGIRDGYDEDGPRSHRKLELGEVPDFIPDLDGIRLKPKAILTDYISTRTPNPLYGMLISKRLSLAVKPFVGDYHRLFQATVIHHNTSFEYYWLHLCFDVKPYILFPECIFYITSVGGRKIAEISLRSYEDYRAEVSKLNGVQMIRAEKIRIRGPKNILPQVFGIGIGGRYTVASEEFRLQLSEGPFTGVLFSKGDWLEVDLY